MTTKTTVLITLGTNTKSFTAEIEVSYCDGDSYTPSQSVLESINYFDSDGDSVNNLINRYECLYSIDVSEIALDELN
tara:strand:- start:119 stop:349 length:231 start_codon:yes stop_codon:yes gene_type:complete